jgi:hypothetical protein
MQQAVRFDVETKTVMFQGKPITLTNRTPIFTPEQREKRRREIERRLYDVVSRHYANAGN